jgi:hypothetical protein
MNIGLRDIYVPSDKFIGTFDRVRKDIKLDLIDFADNVFQHNITY